MNKRLADIAYRRQALLETIEFQRGEVADISRRWGRPLALVDAGLTAVRFIHAHPGLISGGFAALLSLRGMGIAGMVRKGWRLAYLYPAAISFGLKFIFSAMRPTSGKRAPE